LIIGFSIDIVERNGSSILFYRRIIVIYTLIIIILLLGLAALAYMRFEASFVELKRIRFSKEKASLKVLHLSDIHIPFLRVPVKKVKKLISRENPDLILLTGDYIIKPALEECSIEVYRSDHIAETGKISDQMLRGILEEDLCIAILTGYNPNVFYELAIAHAFQRPTILLIEKGQSIPFDLKDMRCVEYDLKPRSLFNRVYAKEIINFVRELEENGWKTQPFLGGLRVPLNKIHDFSEKAKKHGNDDYWMKLISDTKCCLDLMGINLKSWKKNKGFRDILNGMAKEGYTYTQILKHYYFIV
jgi:hypothetical protein